MAESQAWWAAPRGQWKSLDQAGYVLQTGLQGSGLFSPEGLLRGYPPAHPGRPSQALPAGKNPWASFLPCFPSCLTGSCGSASLFIFVYWAALEKEIAANSSILDWRIPWTEEPGRVQSMEWQRVGHDWNDLAPHRLGCTGAWLPH